ncbi:hypothetical protein M0805_004504 [Coniferiporia weirii]|nr:hypothetical protein M0805_004504 [Coniferiporia weirii]
MAANPEAGMVMVSQPKTEPSRPPTAMLNWKILTTLPNFDEESDSSLGNELQPEEQPPQGKEEPGLRLVDSDRRSAALPPIPGSESTMPKSINTSRSTTLVSMSPISPLIGAFQRALTPASDSFTRTNSASTFHYPSVAPSSTSSRSTAPSADAPAKAPVTDIAHTQPASWVPKALVPGQESEPSSKTSVPHSETWWNKVPMPPIPESLKSGSASSLGLPAAPVIHDSPPTSAHLREATGSSGTQYMHSSFGGTGASLSRSNTQHTGHSVSGSIVERDRPVSVITQATFGRPGQVEFFVPTMPSGPNTVMFAVPPASSTGRTGAEGDGSSTTGLPVLDDKAKKASRRTTLELPREPSPPLVTSPLSHPPLPYTPRSGSSPRPMHLTHPYRQSVSRPKPDPQSPDEPESEAGPSEPYGALEDASNSNEHLISMPEKEAPHLPLELPGLRPLSPFTFDFRLGSSSRSSSRNRKRKEDSSAHSKQPSKASTASDSRTGSKRSLKSLASAVSSRSGSMSSTRSKSRERERPKNRRVTFGDEPLPSALLPGGSPKSVGSGRSEGGSAPASVTQTRRPLPPLPALPSLPASLRPALQKEHNQSDYGGYDVP